ncbi:MAG: hypothetical protein N2438_09040 [Limisphaera sp.]|nr:hypothetical protein [Limisphaera sp.]
MSKQYNKILKRRRRQRYIKRKKLAAKLARQAKAGQTAPVASEPPSAPASAAPAQPAAPAPAEPSPAPTENPPPAGS